MVERPLKVQIPFILFAMPFSYLLFAVQDDGPWVVALIVYLVTGGVNAVNYWPVAYRTPLIEIVGRFALVAIGALATALLCSLFVNGTLDGLFARKAI